MKSQIPEGHAARPRLEHVIQAADRAAGLTRQLLAFSRKQVLQPKLLDLGVVVREIQRMLDRVVGEDLEIVVRTTEDLGTVNADATQVDQILMNLVVNARDAMPKGGRVTIETANAEFDETYAATNPPAQAGAFVMLAVSDTGIGMTEETQARIFEPFFTTKAPGEGTGLGLATVYGAVKQMGGFVSVNSRVGKGTTFGIYLPRVSEAATARSAHPAAPAPRGTESVLVVEDTQSLREMVREVLEDLGYTVLTASDGEEALAVLMVASRPIDLLLTDVVMPKMGGADLVRELRLRWPHIRVLFMSGYTDGGISMRGTLQEGVAFLGKPFSGPQLGRAVRQALDQGA
jgi:CheY-like chemotaxis protein